MPKSKWNLNTIYISERLQESLRPISRCTMTAVVAPMGYGKTTAVNWYLAERTGAEALIIRISVYSDSIAFLWKSAQDAFARAGFDFLRDYTCPTDASGGGLLVDDLCHELAGETPCYIFVDDFHLLTDRRVSTFLCMLANRVPSNVHLIVASRDLFLSAADAVRLGAKVYQIGTEQLRLNHTELAIYAHRCGTTLSDAQIESLLYSSEGWFSAVYLNLRTLSERGVLPSRNSDIYTTFTAAMIDPLPEKQREFLAVMGLADEFTEEMAQFVTGDGDAGQLLAMLTEQNAFVTRLPDGVTYRFHHMMKECSERGFLAMETGTRKLYWERFGAWYEKHRQYLHAIAAYDQSENYDALLRVVQNDAGILLSSLNPQTVLDGIGSCPVSTLKAHPLAILVLMRSMFNWRNIPKMLELKELLLTAIEEQPELSPQERGNLLGECDLIMSFLCYNDISAMSRLHRSASSQMSRLAISIQKSGGWTFGSPSVLMMFYRGPGELQSELHEMDECMPHYYKITGGHGQGAEKIMRAEAAFMQGRFTDAHIALENAYAQIQGNGQENMALCCDFLAWRLSRYADMEQRCSFEERREALLHKHNAAWLNIWSATSAYYHALRGETDKIPEIFSQHQLSSVNMLAPGKPMMEMIENQVYLAQGAYAKVLGRSEGLLAVCEGMHYALVAMHIRIQTAAAYERLGKTEEARGMLTRALADAAPDGLVMPFVENYGFLQPMLAREVKRDLTARIMELGEAARGRRVENARPTAFEALTQREFEIVTLMARRLSNREIAERLFLSEGSVKQYVNQIYSKLILFGCWQDHGVDALLHPDGVGGRNAEHQSACLDCPFVLVVRQQFRTLDRSGDGRMGDALIAGGAGNEAGDTGRGFPAFVDVAADVRESVAHIDDLVVVVGAGVLQPRLEVHGGRLPDNSHGELSAVIDAVKEIGRMMDLYQDERIPVDVLSARIDKLHREKVALEAQLAAVAPPKPQGDYDEAVFPSLLADCATVWQSAGQEEKRQIISALIRRISLDGEHVDIEWAFLE